MTGIGMSAPALENDFDPRDTCERAVSMLVPYRKDGSMSPAKKRQTMGKSTRERELRERREQKQEKKDRKKAAAEAGIAEGVPPEPSTDDQ
jgi:hypothetical protein